MMSQQRGVALKPGAKAGALHKLAGTGPEAYAVGYKSGWQGTYTPQENSYALVVAEAVNNPVLVLDLPELAA